MKKNRIFRGGALNALSEKEKDYLVSRLNIKYILDFRDEKEADLAKDVMIDGVHYERIGALQVDVHDEHGLDMAAIIKKKNDLTMIPMIMAYLKEGYRKMPLRNKAYQRLFDLLLQGDGNIYFHCTAGKDRTGVAGFLIMMALGMSEDDAIEEYLKSNVCLKDENDVLAKQLKIPGKYKELFLPLLGVSKDLIISSIIAIKENYATYDEFFEQEYGLTKEKRKKLIELYLE